MLLEKLKGIKQRYDEITNLLSDPEVITDVDRYVKLNKELKDLEPLIQKHQEYQNILEKIDSTKEILSQEKDEDLKDMAKAELEELNPKVEELETEIKHLLIPKDPEDEKNAYMEIRAGTGGDEASIFAGDLYRLYTKFCEQKGWKTEVTTVTEGSIGGFKEVILKVTGEHVYGLLKYESGVHRVQRVPKTETQGRVHTSAATVAVLPEADEVDIEIRNEDIRRDTFCASGPGGQSVNTTYSAIRLTHIPTGIVTTCQDEKSQIKNYQKAMSELRARVYNLEYQKKLEEEASKRRTMVSTGDRSAKIRTYNFPQGRMTDHRINYTSYNLQSIMDGNIQDIIAQLQMAENAERLKDVGIEEA